MQVKTTAPAKVILFGEHSVVYDKLGIAGAINPRTTVKIKDSEVTKIILKDYGQEEVVMKQELDKIKNKVDELIKEKKYDEFKKLSFHSMTMVKAVVAKSLENYEAKPFEITISSKIPVGGFGSGSSIFAATAASIQMYCEGKIDKEKTSEIANYGDIMAHGGTPSGIDASTVTYGGYIQYRKSEGITPLKIEQEIPIVIGNTNIAAKTSITVPHVRQLREQKPGEINSYLNEMDKIAQEGIEQIKKGNLEKIGQLMNENQKFLRKLEISHPKLEKLIEAALKAGALGAKLTGGGGGGIMIALCKPEDQHRIAHSISQAGGETIITKIGAEGVQAQSINEQTP